MRPTIDPARLAATLLTSERVPAGVVSVLETTAGAAGLATIDRIPDHWSPSTVAEAIASAPASDAVRLASRLRTCAHVEAVLARDTRITVVRAMGLSQAMPHDARTVAVAEAVARGDDLSDFRRGIDSDVAARLVLADDRHLGLARHCRPAIVATSLVGDPTGRSLAGWAARVPAEATATIDRSLRLAFARGQHLDIDDEPLRELAGADAVSHRDGCRVLYRQADLTEAAVDELLAGIDSPDAVKAWLLGEAATRPYPGQVGRVVHACPGGLERMMRLLDRLDPVDVDVATLPWYGDMVGAVRVSARLGGTALADDVVERMRTRLGDDPIAWQTACELAEVSYRLTLDQLCDAAAGVTA